MRHPKNPAATSDEHLKALLCGRKAWNNKRASSEFRPYFSIVNFVEVFRKAGKFDQNGRVPLQGYDLRNAHFHGTDLSQVDFGQADLRGAKIHARSLQGTDFHQADLTDAEFALVYAGEASFSCAKLDYADLAQVNLTGADLGWSRYWRAKLFNDNEDPSSSFSQPDPINSVADLIARCNDLQKSRDDLTFYFRGERTSAWPLAPSVMRRSRDGKFNLRAHEGDMLRDLISKRPEDFEGKNAALEQLVVAQHHGLKTRLLDVTRNPCVALFSACDERDTAGNSQPNDMDGSLHVFGIQKEMIKPFDSDTISVIANFAKLGRGYQTLLLGKTGTDHIVQDPDIPIQYDYGDALRRLYHFIRQEKPQFEKIIDPRDFLKVFVVEPKQSFERIRAQEGAFIISAFHERFERREIRCRVPNIPVYQHETIVVPGHKKGRILGELSLMNFTRETLYPSLDEVANRITRDYL